MAWHTTPYALLPLAAAALSSLLVAYVWRYRREPVARALMLLLAAIAAWSLVYAVQLGHGTAADQLFWQRLGLCIGATIPPIWLAFAIAYAGDLDWLTPRFVGLLAVDPLAFSLLAWTNDRHGLLWSSASIGGGGGLDLAFSAGYLVHITYAYLLVLAGIGLLVQLFVRSSAIYRRQAGLLVCGASVPLAANVGFTIGVDPVPGLDLTTSAFAASGLVFALALFRFDLLDLLPVARRRMIDEVGIGVLVADEDDRIVHVNDTAGDVLPSATVGEPVRDLLSVRSIEEVDGLVSAVRVAGRRRFFAFSVSPLRDHRGDRVGHAILLDDVTESRERRQRLEVANRLLRHNLRNDMTKVIGWADIAAKTADAETRSAIDRIRSVAEEVAAMSEKAGQIEPTLEAAEGDLVAVDVVPVIESVVSELRPEWPEATIDLDVREDRSVVAPDERLIETAIRNVVENGLLHNDGERPTVRIGVDVVESADGSGAALSDDGSPSADGRDVPGIAENGGTTGPRVAVTVADDGPGIPSMEREVLLSGEETALEHGSGLGLWLVRWITRSAGGELEFAENEPRGSVITLRFRPAEGDLGSGSGDQAV